MAGCSDCQHAWQASPVKVTATYHIVDLKVNPQQYNGGYLGSSLLISGCYFRGWACVSDFILWGLSKHDRYSPVQHAVCEHGRYLRLGLRTQTRLEGPASGQAAGHPAGPGSGAPGPTTAASPQAGCSPQVGTPPLLPWSLCCEAQTPACLRSCAAVLLSQHDSFVTMTMMTASVHMRVVLSSWR